MEHVNITNPQLLKATEVAEFFRIDRPTVYQWVKKGILNPVIINGKMRFERKELEMIIETKGTDVQPTNSVA
jgi:excisionase family DNA binding protein